MEKPKVKITVGLYSEEVDYCVFTTESFIIRNRREDLYNKLLMQTYLLQIKETLPLESVTKLYKELGKFIENESILKVDPEIKVCKYDLETKETTDCK